MDVNLHNQFYKMSLIMRRGCIPKNMRLLMLDYIEVRTRYNKFGSIEVQYSGYKDDVLQMISEVFHEGW
jgi:hypothetical protein